MPAAPAMSEPPSTPRRAARAKPAPAEPRERAHILVVDDDPQLRATVGRYLEWLGHDVDLAESAEAALRSVDQRSYALVVTDLHMPGASGLELLAELRGRAPGTRMILMTGRAEATDAAAAIRHGIDRLLLKPFALDELRDGLEKALAERRAQARVQADRELFDALVRQRKTESRIWVLRAAHALTAAVEAKDAYTRGHSGRATAYALLMADVIGGIDLASMRLAGDLHDVGKIGVPDAVLNKPEGLTDEEIAMVHGHPEIGRRILEPLIDDPVVIAAVRWHHERWDGEGYPDRLAGEAIPLPARILAVADTLDAMTSSRAYREALSWDVAVAEIRRSAGSQFDPRVVEAFDQALPRLEERYAVFRG